jgi:hypothetical protein
MRTAGAILTIAPPKEPISYQRSAIRKPNSAISYQQSAISMEFLSLGPVANSWQLMADRWLFADG